MSLSVVRFAEHAERRYREYGRSRAEIVDLVLTGHRMRHRNPGSADWLVSGEGLVVVHNWPDADDETALVVSLWPER